MMKFALIFVIFLSVGVTANEAPQRDKQLGNNQSKLLLTDWSDFSQAWQTALLIKNKTEPVKTKFELYRLIEKDTSVSVDSNINLLSPNKDNILIMRTSYGILELENGKSKITENNYCDMVDLNTGCVLLTRTADYCSGNWNNQNWQSDNNQTIKPLLETMSPQDILNNINTLTNLEKSSFIKENIYMGANSYLACYPPDKKNIQQLNNIAYYLAESDDHYNAIKIYLELIKTFPSRAVLNLNLADSLWQEDKTKQAVIYYKKYIPLMRELNKTDKIPNYVFERTN